MRSEWVYAGALAALLLPGGGCFGTATAELPGMQKISLQDACDRAVEHGSTVQFAARMNRLEREEKEALTLTSLPDLENLPDSTPPARRAELWFDALENALSYTRLHRRGNRTEAEQQIRLREEERIRGKTTSFYWLLAEDAAQLRRGKLSAPQRLELQRKLAVQSFELAVHIGDTGRPMPNERFSDSLSGPLPELLKEAASRRADMSGLCTSEAARNAALRLYEEIRRTPGCTPGKFVRILFYLPAARLRSGETARAEELDALTVLLGTAAELDLLLDARKKAAGKGVEQTLKIEALLRTARGSGKPRRTVRGSEQEIREAETQMRALIREL